MGKKSAVARGLRSDRISHTARVSCVYRRQADNLRLTVSSPPRVTRCVLSRENAIPETAPTPFACAVSHDLVGRAKLLRVSHRWMVPSSHPPLTVWPSEVYAHMVTLVRAPRSRDLTTMMDLCDMRLEVSQIRRVESLDEVRNSVEEVGFQVAAVRSATWPLRRVSRFQQWTDELTLCVACRGCTDRPC